MTSHESSEKIIIEAMRRQLEAERARSNRLEQELRQLNPPKAQTLTEKLRAALVERDAINEERRHTTASPTFLTPLAVKKQEWSSSEEGDRQHEPQVMLPIHSTTTSDTTLSSDDHQNTQNNNSDTSEFRILNGVVHEVLLTRSSIPASTRRRHHSTESPPTPPPPPYDAEVEYMLQVLFNHYKDGNGVSLAGWERYCREARLCDKKKASIIFLSRSSRAKLDFFQFVKSTELLFVAESSLRDFCFGTQYTQVLIASLAIESKRDLRQMPSRLRPSAALSLASTIKTNCEVLAQPKVLALIDKYTLSLKRIFLAFCSSHHHHLTPRDLRALLCDMDIVPKLVQIHLADRVIVALVTREEVDLSHFVPQLEIRFFEEYLTDTGFFSFLLFLELLGHFALLRGTWAQYSYRSSSRRTCVTTRGSQTKNDKPSDAHLQLKTIFDALLFSFHHKPSQSGRYTSDSVAEAYFSSLHSTRLLKLKQHEQDVILLPTTEEHSTSLSKF